MINKMLRDLEQRHNINTSQHDVIRKQHQPVWLTILLWLTLLLAVFAIYAVLSRHTPVTTAATMARPGESISITIVDPAASVTAVAAETNITPAATVLADLVPPAIAAGDAAEPAVLAATVAEPAPAEVETKQPAVPTLAEVAEPTVVALDTPAQSTRSDADDMPPTPEPQLRVNVSQPNPKQQLAKLQQQALTATQAGQWLKAAAYWQQIQQLVPQQAQAYLAQARLWLQAGDTQQAEQILRQALAAGVQHADIQLLLAQAAASRQQWSQVSTLLPEHYAIAQHPEYYGLKATALQQLAEHQQAFLWFERLSVLQPQQAKWWLGAAVSLDALARPTEAHRYYRFALQWGDTLSPQSKAYIQQRLAATE